MSYRLPLLQPAALAPRDAVALRGQSAVRIAGLRSLARDGAPADAPPLAPGDRLAQAPAPIAGLAWDRPRIMGIVNVTPDSFSDGGQFDTLEAACAHAEQLVAEGADILDIGGESTRPGAQEVPIADEIARTAPLIKALRERGLRLPISIDTRKAAVAEAALAAGADIVNDVSGLTWDAGMGGVVAKAGAGLCLMHAQGTPQTMQNNPHYDDVCLDVADWLTDAIARAEAAGIDRARLIIDPGIGFGKTVAHNLDLLRNLAMLHDLGCVLLVGASRKRFIGVLSGVEQASDRVAGSLAVALDAASKGAQILRVHDVAATRAALALWHTLNDNEARQTE